MHLFSYPVLLDATILVIVSRLKVDVQRFYMQTRRSPQSSIVFTPSVPLHALERKEYLCRLISNSCYLERKRTGFNCNPKRSCKLKLRKNNC